MFKGLKNGISEKEQKKLAEDRENEVRPIAKKILQMIVTADLPFGSERHAHDNKKYNNLAKEILEFLIEKDVKYVDKEFLFQLMMQPIEEMKQVIMMSLGKSFDDAIDKALGKGFREVRMKDLDKILKYGEL